LRKEPYPLTGKLLLSEFRIEDNPHQVDTSISVRERSPVKKSPIPIENFMVGINYPWINYGWDVGISPYDGRDIGGFSSRRYKLERDFALFKAKGIQVARVFLLADLRTGLVYDEDGKVSGLDKYVAADIDALVDVAAKNGIKLIPVLLDFTVADGMSELDLGFPFWRWKLGEAPQFIVNPDQRSIFKEKALRPIILQIARANDRYPNLIYAVDIVNEVEHALAIITPNYFKEVVAFIREVRDMIRSEAPGLQITLGSRNRDELVNFWGDLGLDIWQYHHYGKMTDEENRPLLSPAGDLGLEGPIIIGEVEPSDIEQTLDITYTSGYDGALFWSYSGLDGFVVDLDAIKRWVEKKTLAAGEQSDLK
ncbi:MAG TPA: hypothetical protein VHT73_11530, partial [Thermodesulfobacteriota bacterium]|nr:hypothetical protein [Thermodesulfobacteriota bacterium]